MASFSNFLFKTQSSYFLFNRQCPTLTCCRKLKFDLEKSNLLKSKSALWKSFHWTSVSSKQSHLSINIPEFKSILDYDTLYQFSINKSDEFWSTLARSHLAWIKDFDKVQSCDLTNGKFSWFENGKLNVSVNCVDRHFEKNPNKIALIWERDEAGTEEMHTYRQLYEMMNQIANMLRSHGVQKGDRVVIYMPVAPLAVASMLACARIGAIHNVVFAGFSSQALASRINDASASTVITADQGVRGGKLIELKSTVDEAVKSCPAVKRVFMMKRTGANVSRSPLDYSLEEEMSKQPKVCAPEPMDSNDPLFLLYTSGSTGKPKGLAHSQAGYILYATLTHKFVFDYQDDDIYSCVADIGWITGHSYVVYGPLSNGATTTLFESVPTYPDPGRYWETVERLKINQFYGAPTAIRLLLKFGSDWVKKYDRSSLRILGSVGEPLNHEAWEWFHKVVGEGRCPIADTWWQTETGGIMITPCPSNTDSIIKPAMPMRPFFGIQPAIVDPQTGKELTGNKVEGALCIKKPWPGAARTIYGDDKRFMETYFQPSPGFYFSGDGALRDEDGFYQLTGRMDDVINVSGHRLGTAEVEDTLNTHQHVAETAVVGCPHEIKGECIYCFVILKENVKVADEQIHKELKLLVRKEIGAFASPDQILITSGLPKTRSGKIMRRILRKIAADKPDELGDISTLADPSVVAEIIRSHENMKNVSA